MHMAGMADANHRHFVAEYQSLLAFLEIVLGIAFSTRLFERTCTFQASCVTHLFFVDSPLFMKFLGEIGGPVRAPTGLVYALASSPFPRSLPIHFKHTNSSKLKPQVCVCVCVCVFQVELEFNSSSLK